MPDVNMTLTPGDYVFYSIMGLCVVFFALALLMAIIKIMMAVPVKEGATEASEVSADETDPNEAGPVLAPGTAGDIKLHGTAPRDAAMIMAIVADELKKPLNELRFISIREVKE